MEQSTTMAALLAAGTGLAKSKRLIVVVQVAREIDCECIVSSTGSSGMSVYFRCPVREAEVRRLPG
jgi:hypothetical protein